MKKLFLFVTMRIATQGSINAMDERPLPYMDAYPLHYAVKRGDKAQVAALLATEINVSQQDSAGQTPLYIASVYEIEQKPVIQKLLFEKKLTNDMKTYPLHTAVKEGNEAQVATLLTTNINVNQQDDDGWTPLHIAAKTGQQQIAQLLLDRGANANQQNDNKNGLPWNGHNGEHRHCSGHVIYRHNDDINSLKSYPFKSTPLHLAASEGHLALIQFLLKKDVRVDPIDTFFQTPLFIAAREGHQEIFQLLLSHGANINSTNEQGLSPLNKAISWDRLDLAAYFLDNGADINMRDSRNNTPLHHATYTFTFSIGLKMAQLLLHRGAQINAQDDSGFTPLHLAVTRIHQEDAQLLLNQEYVQLLLNNGAHVNTVSNGGETPLQRADWVANKSFYIPEAKASAQTIIGMLKNHMVQTECPVCLNLANEMAIKEHSATPCCQQFICKTDRARIKAAGQPCPLCRSSVGWQ